MCALLKVTLVKVRVVSIISLSQPLFYLLHLPKAKSTPTICIMSSMLERPCSNCGSKNCLQLDASRGEIACEECGVVVAEGLEEDEGTRYVKDATRAEAGDSTRGGLDGETFARKAQSSHHEVSKVLNSRTVSYLRKFQEKSKTAEAVLNDAIELCRVISVKKREMNERIDKPFATAAACYQLASQRQHVPLSHHELISIDPSLGALDVRSKVAMLLNSLNLTPIPPAVLQKDALKHYLARLGWNIMLCEGAAMQIIAALRSLSVEGLDALDEVVAALLWVKLGADALDALAKHHDASLNGAKLAELQRNHVSEEATQLELEGATRYPKTRIADILKTMKRERRAVADYLSRVAPSSSASKRPREE